MLLKPLLKVDGKESQVVNFTLAKGYGKGKEYINCAVYGDKVDVAKTFAKGDFVHVYGYFNHRMKDGKTYKNFIVQSLNKIEKKESDKVDVAKTFAKGDFVHVYGYFNHRMKDGKTYKNFIVQSLNKIEKKEN